MSCEESYIAIRRYLTDEREPYAPGTHGNTKRKIRKAAACYVVRNGVLYYQRRHKGQREFTELEVVLQDGRRKELIDEAHIAAGGEHLTQQQTWETISQKYWWRGILKQVKDYIRECSQCQSRQDRSRGYSEDGHLQGFGGRAARRRPVDVSDDEEEDDTEDLDFGTQPRSKNSRGNNKHELVFVDSKGVVKQFLHKHGQSMMDKLNLQRVNNQFCDITLLIEGEEYRAHKAVLAACSDYFYELFIEKGAVASHEAVVDLSGFSKASILPLLDFAYTSNLTFNFCVMAEVATLARHLLMSEVLEICESVHRKVEEQKLTVYQRGDIHTVVSAQPLAEEEQQPGAETDTTATAIADDPQPNTTYMVTMQSDGQAVVTHSGEAVATESLAVLAHSQMVAEAGESLALLAQAGQVGAGESLTLMAPGEDGAAGETMTVITHSGQAGSGESLAVVQACWKVAPESMDTGPYIISVDSGKAPELVQMSAVAPPADKDPAIDAAATAAIAVVDTQVLPALPAQSAEPDPAPPPPKRKRGRPAKVKPELLPVVEPEEVMPAPEPALPSVEEEQESASDDPNRRRLRQRSVGKGGYVRLHMGLDQDEEEEDKKAQGTPISSTVKRRGPRPGLKRSEAEEAAAAAVALTEDAAAAAASVSDGAVQAEDQEAAKLVAKEDGPSSAGPGGDGGGGGGEEEGGGAQGKASESAVDGEHTCGECGMVFERRYALIMHTLKHEKTRGFKCGLCNKEFQYAASLRAHMARHKHRSQRTSSLPRLAEGDSAGGGEGGEAGKGAKERTTREFVCDICGKTMPKLYSLRIHMLNHTGVRPHACRVCGKTFANKHSLKMHRMLHENDKQFLCSICNKTFVSKRSLEDHTSLHTGESKYLCTTCGKSFHRASGLSKHLKRHQPRPEVREFECSHCDKSFYEAKDLQQHMNKHLGLKPFQCQVCGKCYSWKKDWYSHVKSHTVAEPYRCNVCGKEFFEKALFRRHVKKATHGKKGRIKQNLERECEHCGRKFTQLREYRRHMNNHQGVKPFECLTCGVAWADARSLKRHVRTHTGERPYVCPVCQEAHIDARTLRKHMTKLHGDYLPGKIMLEKDTLQFHNQGTQVEHAVSLLPPELPPELRPTQPVTVPGTEEIETVLITEETVEAMEAAQAVAVAAVGADGVAATLSDSSIMQVVNYVLAQQAGGTKLDEVGPEHVIQTMEVEVAHVAEVAEVE